MKVCSVSHICVFASQKLQERCCLSPGKLGPTGIVVFYSWNLGSFRLKAAEKHLGCLCSIQLHGLLLDKWVLEINRFLEFLAISSVREQLGLLGTNSGKHSSHAEHCVHTCLFMEWISVSQMCVLAFQKLNFPLCCYAVGASKMSEKYSGFLCFILFSYGFGQVIFSLERNWVLATLC